MEAKDSSPQGQGASASSFTRLQSSERIALALITCAAAALRLAILDRPLRYDEAYSYFVYAGTGSAWTALSVYSSPNNHIFHSLCMWLSTHLLGLSVISLRLPVLLFGIALVPLTYLLARQVGGALAATIAATLTAGCDLLVTYSADGRGYGVQAALFVASLILVPRLAAAPTPKLVLAFAIVFALALLKLPTLVYAAPTPFVWGAMLARAKREGFARRLGWLAFASALAGVFAVLLYTPALLYVHSSGFRWGQPLEPLSLSAMYGALLRYFIAALPSSVAIVVLVSVAAHAVCELRLKRVPLFFAWIGVPLAALALHMMVTNRPPFARNFVFAIPLVFVLCGRALESALALAPARVRVRAESVTPVITGALFLCLAPAPYGRYMDTLKHGGINSRVLFEQVVRGLAPGDEFAAPMELLVPVRLYAVIAGVNTAGLRGDWWTGDLRVVDSEGGWQRSRSREQRFLLLALQTRDRDRVPRSWRHKAKDTRHVWIARRRFRTYMPHPAQLWELVRLAHHRSKERPASVVE